MSIWRKAEKAQSFYLGNHASGVWTLLSKIGTCMFSRSSDPNQSSELQFLYILIHTTHYCYFEQAELIANCTPTPLFQDKPKTGSNKRLAAEQHHSPDAVRAQTPITWSNFAKPELSSRIENVVVGDIRTDGLTLNSDAWIETSLKATGHQHVRLLLLEDRRRDRSALDWRSVCRLWTGPDLLDIAVLPVCFDEERTQIRKIYWELIWEIRTTWNFDLGFWSFPYTNPTWHR